MKKSLIALAVLAASSAAMAQSSVTLFGVIDETVQIGRGSLSDKNALASGGLNTSRLGFRGTEDLGGGLAASFWLEAGLAADNGSGQNTSTNNQVGGETTGGGLTFNRRSTASLSGAFGEVRLGRDYSTQFKNLDAFDPFGTNGSGQSVLQSNPTVKYNPTLTRVSNSASYFLPSNLGGFYGQVQGYLGELPQSGTVADRAVQQNGNGMGGRVGFANGPIDVAASASITKASVVATPGVFTPGTGSIPFTSLGNIKSTSLGGSYDLGVVKLMTVFNRDNFSATSLRGTGGLFGITAPIGAGLIRASYAQYRMKGSFAANNTILSLGNPRVEKLAVGYVHNLSKRTALYTTFAHLRNKNGANQALAGSTTNVNGTSNGYDFGVRHSF